MISKISGKLIYSLIGNPYITYVVSFTIVICFYKLEWSDIFPILSLNLLMFFVSTFIISFVFIFLFKIDVKLYDIVEKENYNLNRNICILLYLFYALEFIYNRGIPLLLILNGQDYDYSLFGIPTLHVVLVTFTSFFTVYLFSLYLEYKSTKGLFLYISLIAQPILIFNRGMLFYILFSCFLLYFIKSKNKLKIITRLIILFVLIMYLFGVAGNVRSDKVKSELDEYSLMEKLAQPSERFERLGISPTFLWSYIYIVSPMGNLQYNLDSTKNPHFNINNIPQFILEELIPDALSKKMLSKKTEPKLIVESFNVSTIYTNSFIQLGWIGMYSIFFFSLFFSYFYMRILNPKSRFYLSGVALINTLIFFNLFSNMFSFGGMSLQLIFPLLAQNLSNIRFTNLKQKL